MENKILVMYIGVMGLEIDNIEGYVNQLSDRIVPKKFEGDIILIPTQSADTRIECINPKYVTDEILIQEHTKLMNELKSHLIHQVEQLKTINNE